MNIRGTDMSKRDDLIAKYAGDMKDKLPPDMDLDQGGDRLRPLDL